jgi:hypothetical protein
MTDVLGTLINLFARYRVEEITNGEDLLVNAFQRGSYDAVKQLQRYNQIFDLVLKVKVEIEDIQKRNPASTSDQAIACLIWLRDLREESPHLTEKYKVARELVGKSLYQTWPLADRQAFNMRVAVFEWTDFFISYTNRNANAINNRYSRLLKHHYKWPLKQWERENINCVAKVIMKFIQGGNVRGFADWQNLECGDDIKEKCDEHCRTTVAFIQLVEDEVFAEPPPPDKNWCFEEYSSFTNGDLPVCAPIEFGNRCFFTLAGAKKLDCPPVLPTLYEIWVQARDCQTPRRTRSF